MRDTANAMSRLSELAQFDEEHALVMARAMSVMVADGIPALTDLMPLIRTMVPMVEAMLKPEEYDRLFFALSALERSFARMQEVTEHERRAAEDDD